MTSCPPSTSSCYENSVSLDDEHDDVSTAISFRSSDVAYQLQLLSTSEPGNSRMSSSSVRTALEPLSPSTAVSPDAIVTDVTQSPTPRPIGCEGHNHESTDPNEEMRGFKVFLIASQMVCLLVMAAALITTHVLQSPAAWPVTAFFLLEAAVFVIAVLHACRPSFRMLLVFLSMDIAISLTGIVLALVMEIKDGGNNCVSSRDQCSTFDMDAKERFRFFWFLLTKATFSLFFSLVAVAYSPQVHDFLADDECERSMFASSDYSSLKSKKERMPPPAHAADDKEKDKDSKDKDDDNNNTETPPDKTSTELPKDKEKEKAPSSLESFKGSTKSAQLAKAMVQTWVQRALDVGVPGLQEEFKALAKWKPENMKITAFEANREKNRYLDVPCGDNKRVTVKWAGLPNDYIHANYVATPSNEKRFICTQGPLENTQFAFWAMTVQENVENIVMLCNTIECGKLKCMQYFPREKDETVTFGEADGAIHITNMDVKKMSAEDPTIRVCKLKLEWKDQKDKKEKNRTITHFQWENWPDRGVPPTKLTAVALLSEVRSSKQPILVHCSAGIGRTGTIVAIAYVQERMQKGQSCMAMDELLKELRNQRPYSIQNEFQYIYLHRVLLAYFLEKYKARFASSGPNTEKYAKWCAEYKAATGCD